ncbi:TonB-dependent receptor [Rhodocytophaga aerolata]|uniref:TonB-dependent receptor n=1 Tax=Rhodocytophaga aerolata TaxID=455078 RepID=A0ABT8R3B0_9BACT|nr:TonB-dependent receptor [Rhodocytophaga aerolata]MDO1446596.1 TonB-dependent receptor [Rhodocytophaga aerolata]
MKKILLLLLLVYSYGFTLAQNPSGGAIPGAETPKGNAKIAGTVLDASNQEPVPFVNVVLTDPATGKTLDGTVGDENGKFTLNKVAAGDYKILVTFIGYQTKTIDKVNVGKRGDINLGTIKISPTVQELQEVTIEGQRSLVEEKVDRTVYNAEIDATNKGGDATDVLRKVPMLSVDLDGNVSLRGNQNIRVLINNRPSTIAASSVADALKQIPSDMIKSVEVITSPSSRYDAEGSSGIINIITKKNTLEGFNLNVNGSAGYRGSNLGLNGSMRKGKMGFSLGGFGRVGYNVNGRFENTQTTLNNQRESILSIQSADTRNQFGFGRYQFGWDYDIDKNNFINASVQYGFRNRKTFQDNLISQTYIDNVLDKTTLQDVDVSDLSGNLDVNLGYTHTFNKPQKELSLLGQYSRNKQTNDFIRSIFDENDFSVLDRRVKNLNESYNQETTLQLDYQTPIGKTQILEFGGKEIMRQVTSDFQFFNAFGSDGVYIPDTDRRLGNVFNYNQSVTAGYLAYTLNTKQGYSLKAGGRYEYTIIDANFQDEQDVEIPAYGTFVPSLNLSKKLKNGNILKAAYNRRIQRPSLQFLNPNIQSSNPLFVTIGNPVLNPEFTNNYELAYNTYIKKTSLSFTGFWRNTTGSIQAIRNPVTSINEVGDTINSIYTTYENIGTENAYGVSLFSNVNISDKFSLNGGTDVYYAVLNNNVDDPIYNASNEGWVYNIRGFANYKLGKGWGLQAFGFYRGRQVQLQGKQSGFGIYSLNIQKEFNNKKGTIGIGAENFLTKAIYMRNELSSPLLTQTNVNEMRNMNFKINFSYRIGKMTMDAQPRRRKKSISNDDIKEGGDSGTEGGGTQGGGAAPQNASPAGQRPAQGQPNKTQPTAAPNQQTPANTNTRPNN